MKRIVLIFFILAIASQLHAEVLKEEPLALSKESIDILVGTPEALTDPLNPNSEKTSTNETDMTAYLNEWDENDSDEKLTWDDAEDSGVEMPTNSYESQYLDLISETAEGNSDHNNETFLRFDTETSNNHVESENKL